MTTLTGSSVLARDGFARLRGKKFGLVANYTARLSDGTSTLSAMCAAGAAPSALFAPEDGAFGTHDQTVPDETDPATGLTIFSLYGEHKRPTPDQLTGLDALVFELMDIGARFYTYSSTLGHCLQAAYEAGIPLYVLDRPNPITGNHCEGPLADADRLSFVAYHTVPTRHGLTLGELARLYCGEKGWGETAQVIACEGWGRGMWYDETGIAWVDPSPAMRSLGAATLYPGVCLLEQTNVSVGRGTPTPFERAGAPFIDGDAWCESLSRIDLPGAKFSPDEFTPELSKHKGERCRGVRITIADRDRLDSVRLGIAMAATLRHLYGESFAIAGVQRLLVNQRAFDLLASGAEVDAVCESWHADIADWKDRREPYLVYG